MAAPDGLEDVGRGEDTEPEESMELRGSSFEEMSKILVKTTRRPGRTMSPKPSMELACPKGSTKRGTVSSMGMVSRLGPPLATCIKPCPSCPAMHQARYLTASHVQKAAHSIWVAKAICTTHNWNMGHLEVVFPEHVVQNCRVKQTEVRSCCCCSTHITADTAEVATALAGCSLQIVMHVDPDVMKPRKPQLQIMT